MASEGLEKLKEDRKQGKKRVAKAVSKIADGINRYKYTKETLYESVLELEREHKIYNDISDDFKDGCKEENVSDDFCKINNLDLDQYDESVTAKFLEGKQLFETFVLNLQSAPLTTAMSAPAPSLQNATPSLNPA